MPPICAKLGGATSRVPASEPGRHGRPDPEWGSGPSRIDVRLPLDLADVGGLGPLRPLDHLELDLVAPYSFRSLATYGRQNACLDLGVPSLLHSKGLVLLDDAGLTAQRSLARRKDCQKFSSIL